GQHEDEQHRPVIERRFLSGQGGHRHQPRAPPAAAAFCIRASLVFACRTFPSCVMIAPFWMSSFRSRTNLFSFVKVCTNDVRLRENSRLAWDGSVAGRLSGAM